MNPFLLESFLNGFLFIDIDEIPYPILYILEMKSIFYLRVFLVLR